MKPKLLICLLLLAGLLPLRAQTNDLQTRLQQGLLAEEAAHDLPTAITTYQALAAKFAEDREVAATAVYRLGECYRKLGQTNNAAAQYERILREFADVKMLPDLCRQNLAGMGLVAHEKTGEATNETPSASLVAAVAAQIALRQATEEMNMLKAQIEQLEQASPQEQRKLIQKYYPDSKVASLLKSITFAEQFPNVQPKFTGSPDWDLDKDRPTNMVQFLNIEVDKEVAATLDRLRSKYARAQQRVKDLEAQHPMVAATPDSAPDAVPVLSKEDLEIARLQQMLQNSPDLINRIGSGERTPLGNAAVAGQLKVATYLLDHGADVNAPADKINASALYLAAQEGNRAMVELLLKRGAAINSHMPRTGTALLIAVSKGYESVTETLLANHADVNIVNADSGVLPIHLAIVNGNLKIVQLLLTAGAQIDRADWSGRTPLALAAEFHSPEMVDALLTHHADVTVSNQNSGETPLFSAVRSGNIKTVQLLLTAGAQVNLESRSGRTPLSYAAENRSPEIAIALAKNGAHVNDGKLDAPLLVAISGNDPDTTKALLEAGADPNALGDTDFSGLSDHPQGYNPNFRSGMISPLWLATRLDRLQLVQLLLKYKADPEIVPPNREALVFLALQHPDILKALLDAGAKVDTRRDGGSHTTPLAEAAAANLPAAVEILLDHGADPNARCGYNCTPLHYAAMNPPPQAKIFALLLEHHANPNVRDDGRMTPLLYVEIKNSFDQKLVNEIATLLRQHGALDDLPDWDSITLSRPAANFSTPIFKRNTNDWNHFTLLELIGKEYLLSFSDRMQQPAGTLAFPDLTHVVIVRPETTGTSRQRIVVNLLNATNGWDLTQDRPLEFGDVVELPEHPHLLSARASYLPPDQWNILHSYLDQRAGTVQLSVAGGAPVAVPLPWVDATINAVLSNQAAQAVLTSQCDLDHVKVVRTDAATGKRQERILKYPDPESPSTSLWLRNGDRIEILLKP